VDPSAFIFIDLLSPVITKGVGKSLHFGL